MERRAVVGERLQARLALAQRVVGEAPVGDVLDHGEHAAQAPVGVGEARRVLRTEITCPFRRSMRPSKSAWLRRPCTSSSNTIPRRPRRLRVGEVAQGPRAQLGLAAAGQAQEHGVRAPGSARSDR
jgi:hypothetical protein